MYKLDKKDFQILFELDKNARVSINNLAKKTRLSRDVVSYRMKQLEKHDIIKKYLTIVDFSKFGYQITRLYIKFQKTTPKIEQEIINFFVNQPNTLTVYKVDGYYNLAIGFLVKSLHNYQKIYEKFLTKYKTYISEKNFSIFLDYIHYERNYLIGKKQQNPNPISTGSFKPSTYDKKDIKLLELMKENARISLIELAEKLNMTASGVKYKIKNLEKNGTIVANKLLLNSRKLGYNYYKIDLELEDLTILPALTKFISEHPNVIYRDLTVGGSDFEFDCELKNQEELYKLINEIKSMFPKKIRNYFYFKAIEIFKYSYFPENFSAFNSIN